VIQLTAAAACRESARLMQAGAEQVDGRLRLWRLEPRLAATLVPTLRARGDVVFAQHERTYRMAATTDTPDPLQGEQWWLSQIGIDGLTPPGPGVPVTIVDSGLDVSQVITHRFPYSEFEEAFHVAASGESGKVLLDWKGA